MLFRVMALKGRKKLRVLNVYWCSRAPGWVCGGAVLWALVWGNIFWLEETPRGAGAWEVSQRAWLLCSRAAICCWLHLQSYPALPCLHFVVQTVFLSPIQLEKPYLRGEAPR